MAACCRSSIVEFLPVSKNTFLKADTRRRSWASKAKKKRNSGFTRPSYFAVQGKTMAETLASGSIMQVSVRETPMSSGRRSAKIFL